LKGLRINRIFGIHQISNAVSDKNRSDVWGERSPLSGHLGLGLRRETERISRQMVGKRLGGKVLFLGSRQGRGLFKERPEGDALWRKKEEVRR